MEAIRPCKIFRGGVLVRLFAADFIYTLTILPFKFWEAQGSTIDGGPFSSEVSMLSARSKLRAGRERSTTEPGKLRLGASWIEDQTGAQPHPQLAISRRESTFGSVKDLGRLLAQKSARHPPYPPTLSVDLHRTLTRLLCGLAISQNSCARHQTLAGRPWAASPTSRAPLRHLRRPSLPGRQGPASLRRMPSNIKACVTAASRA